MENRIALHTSWDNTRNGIGDWLCQALPNKNSRILSPSTENIEYGVGRYAEVQSTEPITLAQAVKRVKKHTSIKNVHVAIGVNSSLDSVINSFAVCPGSGSSVLKGVEADLYISGECQLKYILFVLKFIFIEFLFTR